MKELSANGKATFLRTILTRCFAGIAGVTFHIVDSVGTNTVVPKQSAKGALVRDWLMPLRVNI